MKKILVALDGSPREPGVLRAAAKIAKDSGAQLVLFHAVFIPSPADAEGFLTATPDFATTLERQARARLEVAAREVGVDRVLRTKIAVGTPWSAICREAQEDDVDMIVLGSHGYGVLDHLLGTTAAKVVNHADRAVLVVRADERIAA